MQCHFEDAQYIPRIIRLRFVKDEVMHYVLGCMGEQGTEGFRPAVTIPDAVGVGKKAPGPTA